MTQRQTQNARLLQWAREDHWLRQDEWWDGGPDGGPPIKALRTRVAELEAMGYHFDRRWGAGGLKEYRLAYMPGEPTQLELEGIEAQRTDDPALEQGQLLGEVEALEAVRSERPERPHLFDWDALLLRHR